MEQFFRHSNRILSAISQHMASNSSGLVLIDQISHAPSVTFVNLSEFSCSQYDVHVCQCHISLRGWAAGTKTWIPLVRKFFCPSIDQTSHAPILMFMSVSVTFHSEVEQLGHGHGFLLSLASSVWPNFYVALRINIKLGKMKLNIWVY